MKIAVSELKNASLIAISGRIDSDASAEMERALRAVQERDHYNILVDMGGLEFVSSAALRALMAAQRASKRSQRGEVTLLRVPENIYNVLEMAGLVDIFRFVDNPSTLPELEGVQLETYPES